MHPVLKKTHTHIYMQTNILHQSCLIHLLVLECLKYPLEIYETKVKVRVPP